MVTMAVVIADAVRLELNPSGVAWERLQPSERDRWVAVGEAVLRRIWELDL